MKEEMPAMLFIYYYRLYFKIYNQIIKNALMHFAFSYSQAGILINNVCMCKNDLKGKNTMCIPRGT